MKDSVLSTNTKWNFDGTIASVIQYDVNGKTSHISSYTYEKRGSDSIITFHNSIFIDSLVICSYSRYYFNEKNQFYKYEVANDSSFTSIPQRQLYTYDEAFNLIEASVNYPGYSRSAQTWKWQYDTINYVIKLFTNDKLHSVVNFNLDSCLVEDTGITGGDPVRIKYYFDYNQKIFKEISYYEVKKNRTKSYTTYREWSSEGKLVREYGSGAYSKAFDIKYMYDENGLLIQEISQLTGETTNYYYVFKN